MLLEGNKDFYMSHPEDEKPIGQIHYDFSKSWSALQLKSS